MAYLQPFLRLVAIGSLPQGETWTWSMSFGSDFGPATAPEEVPAGVLTAIETFHGSSDVALGAGVTLDAVKLNMIGTDGRYVNPSATVEHVYETPVPAAGTIQLPPQCATAVSLLTNFRRGLAHRGRFYVPRLGRTVGTDGRLSTTEQSALLTAAAAMVDSLNDALGPNFFCAVTSDRREGAQRRVSGMAVGRVVDTIRSRRRGLDEDYLEAPIVE